MKKSIVLISVLLVILVVFAGCNRQTASTGGAPAASAGETGEVVFWTSHTGLGGRTLESIVDRYNATNPAMRVKFTQVLGSETDTAALLTAVRGGTGPDVYMLDRFIVAQRASDGILTDLTDVIARVDPQFPSRVLPFAWGEAQYRGRTYAFPFDTDTRGLFYNMDMLRQAGVDPNTLDRARGPLTLDQLWEISNRVNTKDAQGNYTRIGFIPQVEQGWHYTWGFDFGGEFADLAAGRVTPTNPGVVAGFQFLYDWNQAMGVREVQTFISSFMPPNNPPQNHPFITGNLAMMVTGDWQVNTLEEYAPDVNWSVTYIPVPKAGDPPSTWAGGWSMVVPVGSNRIEGAVRFMTYICGVEGQRAYFLGNGNAPTLLALLNEQGLFPPNKQYFQETLGFTKSRPALPVGALYWDALSTAQDMVVQNVMTPQQALQQVYDQVQPQLNRFLPLQ